MCLENFRVPTEEERSKVHIGYKIVKKIPGEPNRFTPVHQGKGTVYVVGEIEESDRLFVFNDNTISIQPEEYEQDQINFGIHFYTDSEIEKYPFEPEEDYSLIKIEIQGKDLVAFGEGPCPVPRQGCICCPCPCPYPCRYRCRYRNWCPYRCRYQAVATKIKVLEEIKDETGSSK